MLGSALPPPPMCGNTQFSLRLVPPGWVGCGLSCKTLKWALLGGSWDLVTTYNWVITSLISVVNLLGQFKASQVRYQPNSKFEGLGV